MWKAFDEMERLGWIGSERPKIFTVQGSGCAPMVRAWAAGQESAEMWQGATTYASGLRVPGAVGDFLILRALRESGGGAVAVADHVMAEWVRLLGRYTVLCAPPGGGATAAAVPMLMEMGLISTDDEVVLFNTGSGLKYVGMEPID
jgi:threonine synthase